MLLVFSSRFNTVESNKYSARNYQLSANVSYRKIQRPTKAWQSPTAYIMLCWRFAEGTEVQSKICAHVNRLSQSEYSISRFAIPRERYVQFYIKMVNNGSRSKSSVVVDRILVETQLCTQSNATQKSKHLSVNRPPPPRAHASTPHVRPYRTSSPLPSSPERELKRVAQRASSSTSAATNPLNEIFGKEFAEFLREDLDTTNQDRAELMTSGVNKSPLMTSSVARSKLVTSGITQQQFRNAIQQPERSRNPVIQLLSGESLGIESLACNTVGGCLFDHSMCSYRNSNFARKGIFRMVSVMNQRFVQAIVPPGGTAILEAETRFPEERVILFDLLEFTEGETLSVCCLKPQNFPREFICSYITQPRPTAVVWQTSRIVCPAGTTKLMFVCENYGRFDGSCSIDNIRLHKTNDILQLEPCQKNILRST
ncbi:hypothetical protein Tcan_05359 [Toxocara canis]|uniref:MAM domain-containing protein n=1 Tax=Toxocara canis TaxID=6265 RepID=A0A0B2W307_TOXCA|nr:hypothetical protein Tcan_05359 [Toxocara canis]